MYTILISNHGASWSEMTDRVRIPKVVASEMGTVQTHAVKSLKIFLRESGEEVKDASRCGVSVVSVL